MRTESFRLSKDNAIEVKIADFLDTIPGRQKSVVIKEALDMYIEMINQGLYECPAFKEKEVVESKFKNMMPLLNKEVKVEAKEEVKQEEPKQVVSPNTIKTPVKLETSTREELDISIFNDDEEEEYLSDDGTMFFNPESGIMSFY